MADKEHDDKSPKLQTPSTPFGSWRKAPVSTSAEEENAGPRGVVSNADGSQRPADEGSANMPSPPPPAPAPSTPPVQQEGIKSFSATFGHVKEDISPLPVVDDIFTDEAADTAKAGNDASTMDLPAPPAPPAPHMPDMPEGDATANTQPAPHDMPEYPEAKDNPLAETADSESEESPTSTEAFEEEDPFAWTPGAQESAHTPRHQASGEGWMRTDTSYEELQNSTREALEAAEKAIAMEKQADEEIVPTVDPYNFNKEEEWVAPPMDIEALRAEEKESGTGNKFEFNASISGKSKDEEAPAPAPEPEEDTSLSPFNFAFEDEEDENTPPQSTDVPSAEQGDQDAAADTLPEELPPAPPAAQEPSLPDALPEDIADIREPEAALPEHQPYQPEMASAPEEPPAPPAPEPVVEQPQDTADTAHYDLGGTAGESPDAMLAAASEETVTHEQPAYEEAALHAEMGARDNTLTPEHIQSIVAEHGKWLQSDGRDGRRANFRNADLQGADLTNQQLPEASFRGANLVGANLSGSDLRGADLSEAQLASAVFASAALGGAVFSRADVRNASFDNADLQGADFSSAVASEARFAGLNLAGAVFLQANLQQADFSHAVLQQANLRGANLTYANLTGANLSEANCRDVHFDHATLDNAAFDGANLKNATMQGTSLLGTNLSSAGEATAEQRQETLHMEKEQIAQEWQRLKDFEAQVQALQSSIQQREMTLQTERMNHERARKDSLAQQEKIDALIAKAQDVMKRHRVHDRRFKYYGVLWFIFTIVAVAAVMSFVSELELSTLGWLELGIVFGACALVLWLFIATTIRSAKLSANLKQLLDLYEKRLDTPTDSGQ